MGHIPDPKSAEIDSNLTAFLEQLPSLMADHADEYALIRHRKIVKFFPSALDAQIAGNQNFQDGIFSIQQVQQENKDLGYYTYTLQMPSLILPAGQSTSRSLQLSE